MILPSMLRRRRQPARTLVWAGTSLAALLVHGLSGAVAVAVLVLGAVAALALLRDSWYVRLVTVGALAPAALGPDAPAWAFVVAAGVVALWPAGDREIAPSDWAQLQRHLERARRRGEPAHVLVVDGKADESLLTADVIRAFRVTDSVSARRSDDHWQVVAVLDDHKLDRAGLERRLEERLPGRLNVGWARFPEDGYNLEVLIEVAHEATSGTNRQPASMRPAVATAPPGS